ncbi:Ribokinase-like protein [Rhizopus microsporus]|uniref:Ribokinase-like protein n=1 Tax=Rhizopus microsporus TaxID=58291 RepID=A0A1X0S741_RHIZD|nr:Ribokinase-like protein [Rhizopus microsporus]
MSALGPKDTCDTLLSQLEAKGIMTSACLYRKEPTPSSYIIQSKQTGTRTIISANTIQDITKNEFIQKIETIKTRFNWIHFEGRNGDVVFFSKLYAEKRGYDDPSCFLRDYQTRCKSSAILFCTWGAKGATCLHHGNIFHSPALPVEQVVDTIGAGDTFVAGIICYLSQGYELDVALRCACHLASKKVSQFGFERLA